VSDCISANDDPQKNLYLCIFSGWALMKVVVVVSTVAVVNSSVGSIFDILEVVIMLVKQYIAMDKYDLDFIAMVVSNATQLKSILAQLMQQHN